MFGALNTLELFSEASQWIQAEGLRFILESNRRRQFRNSGSIIWQLNEPFPNVSSTSLLDYYGEAKMAYYWMRQAFSSIHASIEYKRLDYKIGETLEAEVFLVSNQLSAETMSIKAKVFTMRGVLVHEQSFEGNLLPQYAASIGHLKFLITEAMDGLFLVRISVRDRECKEKFQNDYFFSTREREVYAPALLLNEAKLNIIEHGEWVTDNDSSERLTCIQRRYTVRNVGKEVALHIRAIEQTNEFWMEACDQYFSLLPGEQEEMVVTCFRKKAGGFMKEDYTEGIVLPILEFCSF
ncbi:hypothetical protein D3C73_919370 [compost metagenome]